MDKFAEYERSINFVQHLLSFSNDNDEIVGNLRDHFDVPEP